jgi:hypothetical protein
MIAGSRYDSATDQTKVAIPKKEVRGYSMVNAIENVVSFPVTFSQGRI